MTSASIKSRIEAMGARARAASRELVKLSAKQKNDILIAMAAFVPQSSWTQNSRLSPYFLAGVHAVSFVVPHDLQQLILNGAAQLKHNAPDWIKPPQ